MGKQLIRTGKWLFWNGVFAGLLYLTFWDGVGGAGNLFQFLAWLFLFGNAASCSDSALAADPKESAARAVPAFVSTAACLAYVGMLVWFGWWITGLAVLLSLAFDEARRSLANKVLAEKVPG